VYQKLGPFQVVDIPLDQIPEPKELENGVIYQGQWSQEGEK
jgi:hypothetical protein